MPPRGGNPRKAAGEYRTDISFNSCPREGAINGAWLWYISGYVSTHAPARGQSVISHCLRVANKYVSTHAPARGQSRSIRVTCCFRLFQLMPPRGGNHLQFGFEKGAGLFQLMPPRGGNPMWSFLCRNNHKCFNSCPREGAIGLEQKGQATQWCFNSCPREGAISSQCCTHCQH